VLGEERRQIDAGEHAGFDDDAAVDDAQFRPSAAPRTRSPRARSRGPRRRAPAIASVSIRTPINLALPVVRASLRAKASAMNDFLMLPKGSLLVEYAP
jgi:hypothetical protein